MTSKIYTSALFGLDSKIVEVEVDIRKGLHKFNIVGLPDKAVQESKERVSTALRNSNCDFISRRLTVNLAPANFPKSGPVYDVPIAIGILLASKQLNFEAGNKLFVGELSLTGELRRLKGALPLAVSALKNGFNEIYLPYQNASEAALIKEIKIYPVRTLNELIDHLNGRKLIKPHLYSESQKDTKYSVEVDNVKGQIQAKRALEIAAAGNHNLLFFGSPGSGKSLLAKALPSILPPLAFNESLEVTKVHSIAGLLSEESPRVVLRPFRSPHHSLSLAALIGGGQVPSPGEITLAHRGVLFLDELPEFDSKALEALRQPLENKSVTISRISFKTSFPCNFMLIAAMNPCKCGWLGSKVRECICSKNQIDNYQKRVSGPILDRIDMQIKVQPVKFKELVDDSAGTETLTIRKRVTEARQQQFERYEKLRFYTNAEIPQKHIKTFIDVDLQTSRILQQAMDKLNLSARSYYRTLRVARTIADLEKSEKVAPHHVAEALSFRMTDFS